jgi:ATP-dependent Zn protease
MKLMHSVDHGNEKEQSALKMTLNELLVIEENTGIIVTVATNFADSLDPALLYTSGTI